MTRLLLVASLVLAARTAAAYPQFELSKDQTCAGCHISPAGGGLLGENGLNTAEAISQYGTAPEFMYGKLSLPDWLVLGGDLRGASGYLQTPQRYLVTIPMQADVYASALFGSFRAYVTVGYRPSQYINNVPNAQAPWSREHYLMWKDDPAATDGLYVRVGRFMPVFGLRFAEHIFYDRRFGGTQLYAETYGAAAEYVTSKYEGHLTAFVADPLIDTVEHSSGLAAYGELRLDDQTAVGAEAMYAASPGDRKLRGGVTGKRYLSGPDVLVQGELQVIDQMIPLGNSDGSTTYTYQLLGTALASWFPAQGWMVDVGVNYFNENVRVHGVYRNAYDLNVHWFTSSHFEALLIARWEPDDLRDPDQPTGAYAMLMGHYRL
ncbi:MAG: hypothetical protein ACM31C_05325 [Acidobacteriota bacterium]